MEIAAILIALAAVGIACWALGEARRDDIEERLVQAEVAYMAHADNLTKKVRGPAFNDRHIEALLNGLSECEQNLKALDYRMKRTHEDLSIWREAIEEKLGIELYRVEVPSQPGYSVYREREEENGNSSEAST